MKTVQYWVKWSCKVKVECVTSSSLGVLEQGDYEEIEMIFGTVEFWNLPFK